MCIRDRLRGPLVGLTEEEIADEVHGLQSATSRDRPLHLWTDLALVRNPVLKQTLAILQNLARKARGSTPHQLMAEAVEELKARPILKARNRHGAERALANVELVLEMARPYAARGIAEFSSAMWGRWEDTESQAEGRPDAEADAVSIVTMHSSKGLEWPIVIPINSMTKLRSKDQFLYRRQDDWLSLLTLDLASLPKLDASIFTGSPATPVAIAANAQDLATWQAEATGIAAGERRITWRQPSRHEQPFGETVAEFLVFAGPDAVAGQQPDVDRPLIQLSLIHI